MTEKKIKYIKIQKSRAHEQILQYSCNLKHICGFLLFIKRFSSYMLETIWNYIKERKAELF